jgi:predicted acylesterase/phospholipase RssA
MIRHLVISGGGPNFVAHFGIFQECITRGILNVQNIESVYATSAGTVPAMMLAMHIPISEIVDYFIERPWEKWMKIDAMIFDMKCLCDSESLREAVRPFFDAYDVPMTITFSQFYERFHVDLHFFVTTLDTMESVDFCMETNPDMPVADAAVMSSSLPPIYRPMLYEGRYYFDGGFTNNFPVAACVQKHGPSEVLAVGNTYDHIKPDFEAASAFKIVSHITEVLSNNANPKENAEAAAKCKYCVSYLAKKVTGPSIWEQFLHSSESRKALYEDGKECAVAYFEKINEVEHC